MFLKALISSTDGFIWRAARCATLAWVSLAYLSQDAFILNRRPCGILKIPAKRLLYIHSGQTDGCSPSDTVSDNLNWRVALASF